jgi:beta-aspartyl-dipeptidase (metallo-type)
MFKLLKNCEVYNPKYCGKQDILICFDKIVKLAPHIEMEDVHVLDCEGMIAVPGLIDQHIHLTGGGGEGGFHTRTPEVQLSQLIKSGVTTVVGLLGTDSLTRSIEDLLAKTKALDTEGITSFCLTGAYTHPSPNLTGSISKDIAFIQEILGLKLALSDHRESFINLNELKRIASEVRVSSMVSQKPGMITLHMGDDPKGLDMVNQVLEETTLPIKLFRPTHVNRSPILFQQAIQFLKKGGYIDLTVMDDLDEIANAIDYIESEVDHLDLVTISSDGNGSWSKYDVNGQLAKIGVSSCDGILQTLTYMIEQGKSIEEVLPLGTSNVAKALGLEKTKGFLSEGYDADILLLDAEFQLQTVIARGKLMMKHQVVQKRGTFELG